LWEHWKFSDNTFSHNHPMFGSVSQWLYNWPGGIEPAPDAVAFDKFSFQPQFFKGLDWVRCSYRSVRGPVTCDWKRDKASVVLDLRVPVNTTATLILPMGDVTENGRLFSDSTGVRRVSDQNGRAIFKLESGQYHILVKPGVEP
jgi:alpha-L-rhamnosidase